MVSKITYHSLSNVRYEVKKGKRAVIGHWSLIHRSSWDFVDPNLREEKKKLVSQSTATFHDVRDFRKGRKKQNHKCENEKM